MKSLLGYPLIRKMIGFTLVEMAIVLIIVALLAGGLLLPLQKQKDLNADYESRRRIATIKEALLGYAVANGKLPCPANPVLQTGISSLAGKIDNSFCSKSGVVPWAELGVAETDAWGRRFTYIVASQFSTSFSLISQGDMEVKDQSSALSLRLPVVIISHGKNGYGAYMPDGSQISKVKASTFELENIDDTNKIFNSINTNPDVFDDIVDWVSPNVLFNRMVAAGKLP